MPMLMEREREPYRAWAAKNGKPQPDQRYWVHESHYNSFVRSQYDDVDVGYYRGIDG